VREYSLKRTLVRTPGKEKVTNDVEKGSPVTVVDESAALGEKDNEVIHDDKADVR
jgi:hypothetical protein